MKLNPWKPGTPPIVNHSILAEYIQDTASRCGLNTCTLYNTRVERASKVKNKWRLQTTSLNTHELIKNKETKLWVCRNCSTPAPTWLMDLRNSTLSSLPLVIIMPVGYQIYLDSKIGRDAGPPVYIIPKGIEILRNTKTK